MAFTLTYLGTDTTYTPQNYLGTPRGETLSYLASRIRSTELGILCEYEGDFLILSESPSLEDSMELNPTERLHSGPDTLGSKFYEIMARGVAHSLRAIAHGEDTINIIGHSRGAVESIIASHELERIKKVLENPEPAIDSEETLLELLCQSDNKQTIDYLKVELAPYKHEMFNRLTEIKATMNKVKVNLFLLDPVPGGRVHLISLGQIKDARYYEIPAIVENCHEILLENERSRAFKAIVPCVKEADKTRFSLMSLPGHHGTASGNPYDQDVSEKYTAVPYAELKTKDVQDITLYELYDFLSTHGVEFNTDAPISDTNELDRLFLTYHHADLQTKSKIKLDTYTRISEKKSAYMAFNQTCYATGREDSVKSTVSLGFIPPHPDRRIHYHNAADTFLKSIVSFQSDVFINAAHARLFLRHQLGITDDQTPLESLYAILDNFDAQMHEIQSIFENDTGGELTQAIKSSLQMMFSGLMQTYLRNNLSDEAQAAILEVIERTINIELRSDSTKALVNLVQDLKLYLVENLSKDLYALTVSHQQDVFNLLNSDELSIAMLKDKTHQLKQFQVHLEVLTKYFAAFECVQPQLKASQAVLNDSLDLLTSCRDTLTKHKHQVLILSSFHDRALSGMQAEKDEVDAALEALNGENEQLQARIEVIRQDNTEIYAELQEQQRAYEALQAEKATVDTELAAQIRDNDALSGERDALLEECNALRTERDNLIRERDTQAERISELERLLASLASDGLFHGLSLEILGTFALVLGSAVVALSLVALMLTPVAPIVPLGIALAGAGLATAGFFGMKQGVQEQRQEALYQSSLN